MTTTPPLAVIPEHLNEYITKQDPTLYTYIDHATWRYIMRVSQAFFKKHGHPLYLSGLEATGIPTDQIPHVAEMDKALQKFGWRAVAINGFIPPAIFLEFQSLKILAIACDMRKIENLGYTPAPDIVHEAAGHAPIVADAGYRKYLEAYGEVARNAVISKYDVELYESILNLSEIKESPGSVPVQIEDAQKRFEEIAALEKKPSEAALLTRMAWWTTEYGLIGPLDKPLIYGAGLLSSVSESYSCLKAGVKKIPFNLSAVIETSYDITRPQPQLFVAKDFEELTEALNTFGSTMAYRRGGISGLETALDAENTVTVVFDNGVQITGTVSQFMADPEGNVNTVTFVGQKQVSYQDVVCTDIPYYKLGNKMMLPFFEKSVSNTSTDDLQRKLHGSGLHFRGGFRIQGHFKKEVMVGGITRALLLEQVRITNSNEELIFDEKQKTFPLIFPTKVVSVFGGAADRKEFALRNVAKIQKVKPHKTNLTPMNMRLNDLYSKVRLFRDQAKHEVEELGTVIDELQTHYPDDWLLRIELLELFKKHKPDSVFTAQLKNSIIGIRERNPALTELIIRGLEIL